MHTQVLEANIRGHIKKYAIQLLITHAQRIYGLLVESFNCL